MSKVAVAATPGYFDRKPTSSVRPGLSHLQPDPSSPHTPQQQQRVGSAFSSPSISYRAEEEAVIFEFGTRHFSAGFTGESYPRCRLGFGPQESRRIGDYRKWMTGYDERPRKKQRADCWGEDHELWRMDLREFDIGVAEDRIERAVREAFTKYLLLDSKSRRLLVIIPSVIPHQLLSTLLSTLFNNFQIPSITLLPPSILCTVAAGCRSSLIVDIGWRETVLTAVYDYREICQTRTTRAMRMVTLEMARLLESYDKHNKEPVPLTAVETCNDDKAATLSIGLDEAEEVTVRMAWCKSRERIDNASPKSQELSDYLKRSSIVKNEDSRPPDDPAISIPSPSSPVHSIQIPFSQFTQPVETSLLAASKTSHDLDDHEQALPFLLYKTLLTLPPDVRSVCMSRIMFTGGGSNIPGLKPRLLDEVSAIVKERGWDAVRGTASDERQRRLQDIRAHRQGPFHTQDEVSKDPSTTSSASLAPQVTDPIEEKLRRERAKDSKRSVSGVIRGVETLGAWTGGSLIANLRIKGVVEIEKDFFLQHGLAGARRENEASNMQQKVVRGERTGWTLGAWA